MKIKNINYEKLIKTIKKKYRVFRLNTVIITTGILNSIIPSLRKKRKEELINSSSSKVMHVHYEDPSTGLIAIYKIEGKILTLKEINNPELVQMILYGENEIEGVDFSGYEISSETITFIEEQFNIKCFNYKNKLVEKKGLK